MVRRGNDFEQFQAQGQVASSYATIPMNDGAAAQAAARMFSGLANVLGGLADKAAVRQGAEAGAAVATDAIGLPATEFKAKGPQQKTGSGPSGGPVSSRAAEAKAHYLALGYSDAQAAGIVGNLIQESGLDPNAANPRDPGTSIGLGQWNRERKAALMKFAAARGSSVANFRTQLDFVHHELQTTESRAGAALKAATTVDAATAAMISFERPVGWTPQNPRGGHGWANRLRHAESLFGQKAAGTASTIEASVHVPTPKPLALRRDGTIAGEAYDRAVIENGSWRMQAGLEAELNQASITHDQDPVSWGKARDEITKRYIAEAQKIDPSLGNAMAARAFDRVSTLDAWVFSEAERRADDERKQSAATAMVAATEGLDRQAYLIGAATDGDERLATLSGQALSSIDAAVASGAITPVEGVKNRRSVMGSLVTSRIQGVFDALPDAAAKIAFAADLKEAYADPNSPLARLEPDQFKQLQHGLAVQAAQEKNALDSSSRLEKSRFTGLLADDLASVTATGKPLKVGERDLQADDVARVLGVEAATKWIDGRNAARATFEAQAGLETMPAEAIERRLAELEPAPGSEGFVMRQQVQAATEKRAKAIFKQRREDPAAAAQAAYPELEKLKDDPERLPELVRLRMDAQDALGIGEMVQQPLTNKEAMEWADRLLLTEDNPEMLDLAMKDMMADAQKQFGDYADEVVAQALRVKGVSRDTSVIGADMMRRLGIGQRPEPQQSRAVDGALRRDAAEDAMDGKAVVKLPANRRELIEQQRAARKQGSQSSTAARAKVPNAAIVQALRANPDLAPAVDRRFGPGTAETWLVPSGKPVRTKLPDGSVRLEYPDGMTETFFPDGTVEKFEPPAAGKK